MADVLRLEACAKINLFLDIADRQPNGYHSLHSVMQAVSLSDTLTLTLGAAGDALPLTTDEGRLEVDEHNLICRAARAFFAALGESRDLAVHLEKRIPMQAGLGGGSADCAATLHALNTLCGKPFSTAELCVLGTPLGADVPFCVLGNTAQAEGIGERLTPLPPMADCAIVVAMGPETMPTPAAFRALDAMYDNFTARPPHPGYADLMASVTDLNALAPRMYNIFEDAVLPACPALVTRMQTMRDCGAVGARMSGSGAAVFGLFADRREAERAARILADGATRTWVCAPVGEA